RSAVFCFLRFWCLIKRFRYAETDYDFRPESCWDSEWQKCFFLTPSFIKNMGVTTPLCVPETRAPAHQRSDEKDIRLVYRRRKEATELFGFDVTTRTYGGRAGAAEDLGRVGRRQV